VVTLAADGTRKTIGRGSAPAVTADGSIVAAQQDRLVRLSGGRAATLVRRCGDTLDQPLPSPDGKTLAFTAAHGNHFEVRAADADGRHDRLVLSWDRDRIVYRWSADSARLYAIVGGNWDWQIWEIPLDGGAVRVLASDAASIGDLAVSPDATHLAFTAAPALDYPTNRRQLYVLNLQDRMVRSIDIPGSDLSQVAWADAQTVLVIASVDDTATPWFFPAPRAVKRVHLADGTVDDLK